MKGFGTGTSVTLLQPTWVLWPVPWVLGRARGSPALWLCPFISKIKKPSPKCC